MPDAAETRPESSAGQGSGPDLALLPPGAPLPGLTPAQRELRRRVLDAVSAPSTKLAYGHALDHLFRFLAGRPLDRALLGEWRASMEGLAPSTINVRLSAVRKLVAEARASGLLGVDEAARLTDVPNVRQQGTRLGNWLTLEQARELLQVPDRSTLKGKRDYAILAVLVVALSAATSLPPLEIHHLRGDHHHVEHRLMHDVEEALSEPVAGCLKDGAVKHKVCGHQPDAIAPAMLEFADGLTQGGDVVRGRAFGGLGCQCWSTIRRTSVSSQSEVSSSRKRNSIGTASTDEASLLR